MRRSIFTCLALALLIAVQCAIPLTVRAEGESDILWNQPTYDKKINQIGQRILAANGITERITFVYDRSHVINAYAKRQDGNKIVIYHDILSRMESDDELAAVLSHEIAHITLRHLGKATIARTGTRILVGSAIFAVALAAPYAAIAAGPALAKVTGRASMAPVSRGFEKEADLAGLDYLVKAGYNPLAMETMMNKIVGDTDAKSRFFADHPVGLDRLQYIHTAIVNRHPQFLTEETRNNPVPGSPYQVQAITTIPNRTAYANPPATVDATDGKSNQTMANKPEPVGIDNKSATAEPMISAQTTNPTADAQAQQAGSLTNKLIPSKPATQATTETLAPTTLMLASANTNPSSPTSNPTQSNPTATPHTHQAHQTGQPDSTVVQKTAVIIAPQSPLLPPPARVSYQTPRSSAKAAQTAKINDSHPHHSQSSVPTGGKTPGNRIASPASSTLKSVSPQPAMSVAQTLLELQPDALRLVKLVSQRGMMSHQDLIIEFEALDEETLSTMLLDLQNNKKLLSMQGAGASATYVLTARAARVLHPQ